jgi:hypothetical protein
MTPSDTPAPPTARRWVARALPLLAVTLTSLPLAAQSGDAAAARTLFNEARTLSAAGKFAEACPKFEESLRLNRGIGTQFNLADCWEKVGRIASAWGQFLEVAAGARAAGQPDREQVARDRAAALEPKLPRLVIEVAAAPPGLEVKRDGVVVGAAVFTTPVPMDPGLHVVEATAPGKRPWKGEVTVPSQPGTVSIRVPELEAEQATAAEPAPAALGPAVTSDPASDRDGSSWSGQRTVAVVAAGVGVVGAVVGTVFFLSYRSNNSEAEGICPDESGPCPPGSEARHGDLLDKAESARTLTYVGWGVGLAGIAGGATLWFTAPKTDVASRSLQWNAGVLPGGSVGAALRGRF